MKVPVKYRTISASMEVTDPTDHIEKHWIAGNFYEAGRIGMLHDVYERCVGMTFVDIGAHRGNHSVFFAAACRAKSVIAIEPNADNFAALKKNAKAFPQIRCIHAAAGNHAGKIKSVSGPNGNSGMASIVKDDGEIEMITIDSLNLDECDVIKIDTEGMGYEVLEGATNTIFKNNPLIYVEANTPEEFSEIQLFLKLLGYRYSGKKFNATPTYLFLP